MLPGVRWVDYDANLREVAPGLYVGNAKSPIVGATEGFWTIVDLCGPSGNGSLDQGRFRAYQSVARYIQMPFADGDAVPEQLMAGLSVIARAELPSKKMLIHCRMGLSRASTVAYVVLRMRWGLSHSEALNRVRVSDEPSFPAPVTLTSAWSWVEAHRR